MLYHYQRLMNNQLEVFESAKRVCGIGDFEVKLEWNDYVNCFNAQSDAIDVKQNNYKISCNIYTPIMLEEILKGKGVKRDYYMQIYLLF